MKPSISTYFVFATVASLVLGAILGYAFAVYQIQGPVVYPNGTSRIPNSFEECVMAGNPVMESYPRQCRSNGQTFVEDVKAVPPTETPDLSKRVDVPELGFSYVPFTNNKAVIGTFTVQGTTLADWTLGDTAAKKYDFIERVPQKNGQTTDSALRAFLGATGGSLSTCTITAATPSPNYAWLPKDWKVFAFTPKQGMTASKAQIYQELRSTGYSEATNEQLEAVCNDGPTCQFAGYVLEARNATTQCGAYHADTNHGAINVFVTDPSNPGTLLYVHSAGGGDRPMFDGGLLQILPTTTNLDKPSTPPTTSTGKCVIGGCSAQICGLDTGEPIVSTCEFRAEYACYKGAKCEKQADGQCGWTPTAELQSCLKNPPDLR